METIYYTCRNRECSRYRNIFLEGDRQHEHCKRARLRFDEERRAPVWMWWAVPAALAAAAIGFQIARSRRPKGEQQQRSTIGDAPIARESERHSVPPPISLQK